MAHVIDTNIAIKLRDGDLDTIERLSALGEDFCLSIITRVELEGGLVQSKAADVSARQIRLEEMLETIPVLDFKEADAKAYGRILASTGFSRRKVLDRMIAAQALTYQATLITLNGEDFRDIPGLTLLEL